MPTRRIPVKVYGTSEEPGSAAYGVELRSALTEFTHGVRAQSDKALAVATEARERTEELQAELRDFERASVGRGPSNSVTPRGRLFGEAAESLVAGLRDSNSARASLDFGIRASLSGSTEGAVGTSQYEVPMQNLLGVDTHHSPLVRLIDLCRSSKGPRTRSSS